MLEPVRKLIHQEMAISGEEVVCAKSGREKWRQIRAHLKPPSNAKAAEFDQQHKPQVRTGKQGLSPALRNKLREAEV